MSKGVFVTNEQVRLTGSANVARFLAQCLYWSKNDLVIQRQGWFYKSRVEWQAETWLSRYQQEKARKQLCDMGLLRERRERRNTGIRLWFWLDQALLNVLLNTMADQSINDDPVNNTNELYDSSLTTQSTNCLTGRLDSCKEVEESCCIEEYETIVPFSPLLNFNNGENGTLVSINNDESLLINSDNHCVNEVEIDSEAEMDKEVAVAPSLSTLSNCPDNINTHEQTVVITDGNEQPGSVDYCEDPDAYKACHPFIYQFLKTRLFTGCEWSDTALTLFRGNGLRCDILQDALRVFINKWGHSILAWYQANTPIPVNPLSQDDLSLAVLISEGALQ